MGIHSEITWRIGNISVSSMRVLCHFVPGTGPIMDLGIQKGPGTGIRWTLRKGCVVFYELRNTPLATLDRHRSPQCMQEWDPHVLSGRFS